MIRDSAPFIKMSFNSENDGILAPEDRVAAKIDRVEKEFILETAAETGILFQLQAAGRTQRSRLTEVAKESLRFAMPGDMRLPFRPGERLSVLFEFREQNLAFSTSIRKASREWLEVAWPEAMYRGLARRWPRVWRPRGLAAELFIPGAALRLACPECREYVDVQRPESGNESESLNLLVEQFRGKARELASEGRVIMFKDGRLPENPAEEIASRLGRVLFVPSTQSGLPIVDPYSEDRIITQEMAEDYAGPLALAGASALEAYLQEKAKAGTRSAVWCPVAYYKYSVGLIYLENGVDRPRSLDFSAVDFAWDFSRSLAWTLKRYAYFESGAEGSTTRRGEVIDASPKGLLVGLGEGSPPLKPGASFGLRLFYGNAHLPCQARVARRVVEGTRSYYGLALEGLTEGDTDTLVRGLYGEGDLAEIVQGA